MPKRSSSVLEPPGLEPQAPTSPTSPSSLAPIPGQWPQSPQQNEQQQVQQVQQHRFAPASLYTSIRAFMPTVSLGNFLRSPFTIAQRFWRHQRIRPVPVIREDGARKRIFLDAGAYDPVTPIRLRGPAAKRRATPTRRTHGTRQWLPNDVKPTFGSPAFHLAGLWPEESVPSPQSSNLATSATKATPVSAQGSCNDVYNASTAMEVDNAVTGPSAASNTTTTNAATTTTITSSKVGDDMMTTNIEDDTIDPNGDNTVMTKDYDGITISPKSDDAHTTAEFDGTTVGSAVGDADMTGDAEDTIVTDLGNLSDFGTPNWASTPDHAYKTSETPSPFDQVRAKLLQSKVNTSSTMSTPVNEDVAIVSQLWPANDGSPPKDFDPAPRNLFGPSWSQKSPNGVASLARRAAMNRAYTHAVKSSLRKQLTPFPSSPPRAILGSVHGPKSLTRVPATLHNKNLEKMAAKGNHTRLNTPPRAPLKMTLAKSIAHSMACAIVKEAARKQNAQYIAKHEASTNQRSGAEVENQLQSPPKPAEAVETSYTENAPDTAKHDAGANQNFNTGTKDQLQSSPQYVETVETTSTENALEMAKNEASADQNFNTGTKNQLQSPLKHAEAAEIMSPYANDLSTLSDAPAPPPKKSVGFTDYVRSKAFFRDNLVSEMQDSIIEGIKAGHEPKSLEPIVEEAPSDENAQESVPTTTHEDSVGFRGVPLDTFSEEDSLEESMISSELVNELHDEFQQKLIISPPPPPPAPTPVPTIKPLVASLTTEELDALIDVSKATDQGKNRSASVVGEKLNAHDFSTLLPKLFSGDKRAWLNDNIVNEYLAILVDHQKKTEGYEHKKNGPAPPVHAFLSQMFANMMRKTDSVKNWAMRKQLGHKNFLDARLLLFPICDGSHWRLLAIKPQERVIEYYDSLAGSGSQYTDKALEYLKIELKELFVASEWKVCTEQQSQQQINASDCGIFAVLNALVLLRGDDHTRVVVTNGMEDARERIATTLLAGKPTTEWD